MPEKLTLELFIEPGRAGTYFTLPFTMPAGVETLTLSYRYERHHEQDHPAGSGTFRSRQEVTIVDLGLIAPDGEQVGASGADKLEITLSANAATPGYNPHPLVEGEWGILVGAYKVAPEGVTVTYELEFTMKHLRLFKGDLHTHTIASDGVLTLDELAAHALHHGLDFLAITDHNQPAHAETFPRIPGLTLIPGVEWTHYRGHANFLGVDQPYDGSFMANTPEEIADHFQVARSRGALITANHPFDEGCPFLFDLNALPFDCLEVWNGPMREANLRAIGLWQSLLTAGKKIPICGGSDYHRDSLFQILGGPTTCIYAASAGAGDLLAALKAGHAYVVFAPTGPVLELTAGEAMLGDTIAWSAVKDMQIAVTGLVNGDVIRVVTASSSDNLLEAPSAGSFRGVYTMKAPGFARVEVLRAFIPGIPRLPALISNPIYFAA
jgi:hypothetical protein